MSDTVLIEINERGVCHITLNKPGRHNAFDVEIIEELTQSITMVNQDNTIRVVVLTGAGSSFCSGADLNWMQSLVNYSYEENVQDAFKLATLMRSLYSLDKPLICAVNGPAYGGALGLIACADIVVSVDDAEFSFSEVKLGIIPAVIMPYVIANIGLREAKRLFLTGERFTAMEAKELGLVTHLVSKENFLDACTVQVEQLLAASPAAQEACKKLIRKVNPLNESVDQLTTKAIAEARVSEQGQTGLNAFLKKRKAPWLT
ncbi:Methylglutaconyl-CoA hydratase [hydrothermal vent metagenome]|uniref:Methylglutaconyl-CoA hydratase n=1 Tax=hydrothermal vent metagenome TaxID=652676 RepID=A0A3B0ZRF3_9ZZZZ